MAGVQACSLSTCLLMVGAVKLAHIPFPLRSVVAGNEFFTLNILSRFTFIFCAISLPDLSVSVLPKVNCVNFFVLVFYLLRFILGHGRVYLVFRFYSSQFIFLPHSLPLVVFAFWPCLFGLWPKALSGYLGGLSFPLFALFFWWWLRKFCAFFSVGAVLSALGRPMCLGGNRWEKVVNPTRHLC